MRILQFPFGNFQFPLRLLPGQLIGDVLWMFVETFAGVAWENATNITSCKMKEDPTHFLKLLRYAAISVGALMVAGIATLMVLARGTGEDITGIVAPALLITFVSIVVAIAAFVFQKREEKAINIKSNSDLTI
jgi:hypothetical protein